jgi:acyl carrier protein
VGSQFDPDLSEAFRSRLGAALTESFGMASSDLRPELPLGDLEGWDSMNAVNLSMELERLFEVDLEGAILTADQTLADVVALLRSKGARS